MAEQPRSGQLLDLCLPLPPSEVQMLAWGHSGCELQTHQVAALSPQLSAAPDPLLYTIHGFVFIGFCSLAKH